MLCLCQSGVIRGLAKMTPAVSCLLFSSIFSPFRAQASSLQSSLEPGTPFFAVSLVWGAGIVLLLTATVAGLVWSRYARARRAAKAPVQIRRPIQPSPTVAPPVRTPEAAVPQSLSASKPRVLAPLPPAQVNLPSAATPPQPKPQRSALPATKPKSNGKPLKLLNGRHSHRRKIFDYNRYFADLMSTVSGHTGSLEVTGAAANPIPPAAPQPIPNGHQPANGAFRANSELIASQTAFIEEQRRLIQEQTRVIEEKTKLISEKNQLLKMQTEMLENKLL